MTGSWIISFAGRTFGPYSTRQMKEFAAEGRVAEQSLVARAGEKTFHKALEEPELAAIFSSSQDSPTTSASQNMRREPQPAFGRGDEASSAGERARFMIVADLKSGSIAKLEEAIARLGQSCTIMPQAWLLSSDQPISIIRNLLVQQIGKLDLLFVIDATNDRAAWFNFGPEADARIRKFWRTDTKRSVGA
ncbi:MAG: DUF4339 domain-containing protein [Rhizomicrobium sp.]